MAKYDVTHTCGHTQTHALAGKMTERDRKIEWLETTLCSDCFQADKQAKRQAEDTVAAQANKTAAYPALVGSENQIAWAEKLRSKILPEVERIAASLASNPEDRDSRWPTRIFEDFALWIRAQTSAKYWIDNRELSIPDTLQLVRATGNPLPAINALLTGRGAESTVKDHLLLWVQQYRAQELAAYQAEVKAVQDAQQAEKARQAEAEMQRKADFLAPLAHLAINAETVHTAGSGYQVRDGGHEVSLVNYGSNLAGAQVYSVDGENVERGEWNEGVCKTRKSDFIARFAAFAAPYYTAKASTFDVVATQPDAVMLSQGHYGSLTIRSTDGRVATGVVDYDEWMVFQIGEEAIDSQHPEMERIAQQARAAWKTHHPKSA